MLSKKDFLICLVAGVLATCVIIGMGKYADCHHFGFNDTKTWCAGIEEVEQMGK